MRLKTTFPWGLEMKSTLIALRLLLFLPMLLSRTLSFGAEKPWTLDAIMALKSVSDPQISPDGLKVAYVVREANFQRKAYDSRIWIVAASGGMPRQLKSPHFSDSMPRWSKTGDRLAFLSRRDKTAQVYVVDAPDGIPRDLTRSPTGVIDFKWSPDGSQVGYLAVDALASEERKRIDEGDDPIVANQG